jgi:D-3-phosphoglycerate dehydrogenase
MFAHTCLLLDPMHSSIFELLPKLNCEAEDVSQLTLQAIKQKLKQENVFGIFVRTRTRVDAQLLGDKPTIKFVARAGAGLDNLDLEFLQKHNIAVVHASEGNRDAVGEFTLGILLSLMRNIPKADAEVKQGLWLREENRGMEIAGKTVGIIGYGNMGKAFAKRLSGFDCTVLAYDKYKHNFSDEHATEVTLQQLQQEAEIVSFHVPLTHETKFWIDHAFLELMPKLKWLLNTARGEIISLETILWAFQTKKLRGAALDVLENENLENLTPSQQKLFSELITHKQIVLTPHIAGWTTESHQKINEVLVQKLRALFQVGEK